MNPWAWSIASLGITGIAVLRSAGMTIILIAQVVLFVVLWWFNLRRQERRRQQ